MKNTDWSQAPIPGAVWIQFKDSLPDASGWAFLSLDEKWYKFIGLSREYEVERFQEPNSVGKVYTNPALVEVARDFIITKDDLLVAIADLGNSGREPKFTKENAWNYDFDRSSELFVSNENPESREYYLGEVEPDSVEERLLVDIKNSAYTAYEEKLTVEQAQDILERMRLDVEKTFGIPKELL